MALNGNSFKCSTLASCLCKNVIRRFKFDSSSVSDVLSKPETPTIKTVKGWVKAERKMKDLIFLDVDDGSSFQRLQVVLPKKMAPDSLSYGSSIEVTGPITITANNKVELKADSLNVLGPCDVTSGNYPFLPRKSYEIEYVRQSLHFRPRTIAFSSLLRLRHAAATAMRQYLNQNGFIEIHTPVLTANDCEGAGEVFNVRPDSEKIIESLQKVGLSDDEVFFGSKAYLTVSGQLQLEIMARSLSSVYCFGPTFRAENSKSRLHLSEFYMLEIERAFLSSMDSLLNVIEKMLKAVLTELLEKHCKEIEQYKKIRSLPLDNSIEKIISEPFQILTYNEAVEVIKSKSSKFSRPFCEKEGLKKEHELLLVEMNQNVPVFVINWPAHMKPFYMKAVEGEPELVSAVDLLCPIVGELCGGSLREDDYSLLSEKLKKLKLEDNLDWYLELRKYGNVPTGGFGMGFERFLQMTLGIANIKDTIPFPRWPHNCKM